MSKFKSFASQGSFRDYLLQAPDTTAKEQKEISRVVGQKKENLAWRNEQENLYLRSQQIGYDLEKQSRDLNFKLETDARQARRDQLNQEYQQQVQADQQRLAVQQQNLQAVSQFSKTAFELGTQINNQITENQTKANATRAYAAGADFKTVAAIQSLTNNLTKAEFAQQDFIRDKLEKGGGNLDAYWALYQNRNTRGFINNIAVAQNTAYAFDDAARIHIEKFKNANPSASVDEQLVAFKTFRDETVASFTDANGRALNPELLNNTVYQIIRNIETRILGEFNREKTVEQEGVRFTDVVRGLNVEFANKGAAGIAEWFRTDNSPQKRKDLIRWLSNNAAVFGPGGMTSDQIQSIMDYTYEGPNLDKDGEPKRVSMMEQFKGTDFAGQLGEVYKNRRKAEINQNNITETELKLNTDNKIKQAIDAAVIDGDGVLSPPEQEKIEQLEQQGPIGYKSKELEYAKSQWTVAGVKALEQDAKFQAKANAGTLTVADLTAAQGNFNVYQKFLPFAQAQDKWRSGTDFKDNVEIINKAVATDPAGKLKAAPISGASNWTVKAKQTEMQQRYIKELNRLNGDQSGALSIVLGLVQAEQSVQGSINAQGQYSSVVDRFKGKLDESKQSLAERETLIKTVTSPEFGKDATRDANLLGPVVVYNSYDNIKAGKAAHPSIKLGAELRAVSPLEFINYLAEGAGLPPITISDQSIIERIKSTNRRLYNGPDSTNERRIRASISDHNDLPSAPRRASFGPSQSSTLADPVLRRAADITSNYESAGSGGYNAVNQGGEAGGTSIPAGFYSGDFRAMPQHKGRSLTDLTVGEIMSLQADPGGSAMSDAEWVERGKLHAVGRYQFIGSTLKGLVQRLGIQRNQKFTPELQDRLFLSLLKSGGPGQWIGLRNATAQELAIIRQAQSKL